jgi:hypothetical protein
VPEAYHGNESPQVEVVLGVGGEHVEGLAAQQSEVAIGLCTAVRLFKSAGECH